MEQLPKRQTLALRQQLIGPSTQLFFRKDPLKIIKAKDQYMYDERGSSYLDCINNVAHVGHCNPVVVNAAVDQMTSLNTNSRFLHDNIVLCAQKIVSTLTNNLTVCFFVNSGSEANDLAIRLAKTHTGNEDIIALEHAYHGHLNSLIDISHYKFSHLVDGKKDHVHVAPCPDSYRGKYRDTDYSPEELGHIYAEEVNNLCNKVVSKNKKVAAFIAESFLSCGGQVIPPKNYFKKVYEHVRKAGGVCIADEVQVGFGRIGKHWWAFQEYDVEPDIVTMGKSMGNGHPVACVVTTREIADNFFKTGVEYFNTYGGNPVSCAIANAVLDVLVKQNMREHALIVGEYLLDCCHILSKKHKYIGNVRGVGLFVGIDLIKDPITREANKECADFVLQRMREEHILVSADGPECNIIKFKPPMVFTKENVDEVVSVLDRVLKEYKYKAEAELSISQPIIDHAAINGNLIPQKEARPRRKLLDDNVKSI
ncbi:5-phosphohydroxy-L-lysine phospho-lyase [Cylas formicarius]|uniref:5-phosphohydroxy-L-lysine phospho-lyase n=1 Tax=Cylas formicarius TaxID=197179 RepID=UPI002958940D|nr:5-phosphohydroxy-L-lysine phospho-lyase [Cylas formicarius]